MAKITKPAPTIIDVYEGDGAEFSVASVTSKILNNENVDITATISTIAILKDKINAIETVIGYLEDSMSALKKEDVVKTLIDKGLITATPEGQLIFHTISKKIKPDGTEKVSELSVSLEEKEKTEVKVSKLLKDEETLKALPKEYRDTMTKTETKLVSNSELAKLVKSGGIPDAYKSEISVCDKVVLEIKAVK